MRDRAVRHPGPSATPGRPSTEPVVDRRCYKSDLIPLHFLKRINNMRASLHGKVGSARVGAA